MSLKAGHQKSGGHSLSDYVADHQPELVAAELKKVIKVPANLASLDADGRALQGGKRRPLLRKKPGLDLPGKFELLAITPLGLEPFDVGPALVFYFTGDFRAAEKRKRVAVLILETGGNGSPGMPLRRMVEWDAALAPFFIFGNDVFGQENDSRGPADELVFFGTGWRCHQQEHSCAIRGSDRQRAVRRKERHFVGESETQPIQVELPAALRVAYENGIGSQTKVGILTVRGETAAVNGKGRRMRGGHSPRV